VISPRRRPSRPPWAVTATAAALLLWAACGPGFQEQVAWRQGPLAEALEEARTTGTTLVLDVTAAWCPPCHALDREVWETPAGKELVEGHIPFKVDFDSDEGQQVKRRYNVLGLPTVLFLQPDGTELDRVEGYTDRQAFLEEARRYAAGRSRLQEARTALEEDPGDPAAQVRLGHLLLVRGQEEGIRLLEQAAGGSSAEAAGESLFLLGRYFTRAAEQPARALPYWRRLHRERRETEWAAGALYWLLKSYDEAGRLEEGLQVLETPRLLQLAEDYEMAAAYLAEAGREADARRVALAGLRRFPGEEALEEYAGADEDS